MRGAYRPPDRDKYLLDEEVAKLLKAAKRVLKERPYWMLYFSAHTGARPSETLNVTPEDFRWKDGIVRIRTLKQKIDKRTGKQKVVIRDVDLAPHVVKELGKWVAGQPKKKPLFPCSRITSWRKFKKAAKAARLGGTYTQYALRHSRVVYLLALTEKDYDYVRTQMGHSDVNVTMVYSHCLPEVRQNYRDRMRGTA